MTHGSEVISPPVHPTGQSWGTPEEHICLSVTRTARRAVPWVCPVTRPRTAIPNTTDVPASRRAVALAWGRTAPTRTHRPEGRMASPPNSSPPGTLECDLRQGSMDKEWPRADGVGCRGGGVRTGRGPRVGPTHDPTPLSVSHGQMEDKPPGQSRGLRVMLSPSSQSRSSEALVAPPRIGLDC